MVQGHCVSCDNILNTAYWAFFLLYVLLCGASSSCLSDQYLLQLQVQLFYDAEIRQNECVLSVSLRGNFEKIRIMTTFGSRVTQRGRQFEVRALYIWQYMLTQQCMVELPFVNMSATATKNIFSLVLCIYQTFYLFSCRIKCSMPIYKHNFYF